MRKKEKQEYDKKNYRKNREKILLRVKKHYKNNRKKIVDYNTIRTKNLYHTNEDFRYRCLIRQKHNRAKKILQSKIAFLIPCYLCKIQKQIQIHHPDWNTPEIFIFLCKKCHGLIHGVRF